MIMLYRRLRGAGPRGAVFDLLVLCGIFSLLFVYFKRYSLVSSASQAGVVAFSQGGGEGQGGASPQENFIEARVKQLGDVRSEKCKAEVYPNARESVSIILDFNDYQFYNLKTTIGSILQARTDLVSEIIVVDDGSTLQYIIEECNQYMQNVPNVKLLRHRTQAGRLSSRLTAYKEASSNIVVFLDVNVIVTKDWLEPLVEILAQSPDTIAMPHYDLIHDPVSLDYRSTPMNLVASWGWNLSIRIRRSFDSRITEDTRYVMSPAVHESAFAVRKNFLEKIGSLDATMEDGGGEYFDLSMKTWLCGGSIMVAACSRVGIQNLFLPIKVRSRSNMRHLIQKYMGHFEAPALRLNSITGSGPIKPQHLSTTSTLDLTQCKSITWYLQNIKNETITPSADVLYFGVLRVLSGRCVRVEAPDARVDLQPCTELDPTELPLELTMSGQLRLSDGRCLATSPTAYIVAERCGANDTRQVWRYTDKLELVNAWSGYCARHVTDPDKNHEQRQIAMAQECGGAPRSTNGFKQWSFISS